MAAETSQREREIQSIWTQYKFLFQISGVIVLVIAATFLGRLLFPGDDGYWSNAYMTVIGVIITIGVLDRLAERREQRREIEALKQQLLRDVRSTSNEVAKNAVHQMREQGWIELLKTVNLRGANLEQVRLWGANLQGGNLWEANLKKSNLEGVKLEGALLVEANLEGANLRLANLKKSNLGFASLRNANLIATNMEGAVLSNAELEGALFDETTTLPDGSRWTPETDMERFTNPEHPNFWRSDDKWSPAYRGSD